MANHPVMSGLGGLEWWTSLQADEETVRFVGKLYRHYAIEGRTEMALSTTANVIVSDWPSGEKPAGPFGQEQAFNFLEFQPYHE